MRFSAVFKISWASPKKQGRRACNMKLGLGLFWLMDSSYDLFRMYDAYSLMANAIQRNNA